MKFKRLISFLLIFVLALSVPFTVNADTVTTVIACSDFQNPNGNESGAYTVGTLLRSLKSYGVTSADGFLCCGDYNYGNANTSAGINALKGALSGFVNQNMVFVRGNHDEEVAANVGLSESEKNDTENYGVFVIHESDYMRTNSNESTIKKTAQNLINYLNEKLENGYNKPIFVVSHLPLHYTMRTRNDGDGMHANYIFDVLNEAGQKGLNIIYMYGHDHSNGWDDYLGGAAVYLKKGDNILIAQNSKTVFLSKTLNFTYMNAGFVGYYENRNGADDTLTMTSFKISSSQVEVARYNSVSMHRLKSAGVKNSYKNESGYEPNTTVYSSPQIIMLTAVTDNTPIADLIPDPNKAEGERFEKITSVSELEDGGKYLLVYNSSVDYIMMPSVVTKSNGSTNRRGFDIKQYSDFGETVWVDSNLSQYVWTFKKTQNGWYVGNGTQNMAFTSTTDMSVVATLENAGDSITISGSDGAFTISNGTYVLNYNSRGLINGFASNPAPFYIYKYTGHTVYVDGGSCDVKSAHSGETVTVTAKSAPEGKVFDKWEYVTGSGFITDVTAETVTFTMPDSPVKIKATYKDKPHEHDLKDMPNQNPTCTEAGTSAYKYCTLCDYTEGKESIEPTGHKFVNYVYNNDATTEKNGTKTAKCENCDVTDTVTAEGTKLAPSVEIKDTSKVFTDIKAKAWYKQYVDYSVAYGIFTGTSATTFSPDTNITRAQFVQVFANLEGIDTSNRNVTTEFSDVPSGKWFTAAVKWASENGVVNGMGGGLFAPDANVTREQMCVMLVNFTKFKNITLKEAEKKENFADDISISKWAKTAVYTCQQADIVNGKGEGKFDPQGTGTRAEASVMFTKFHKDYLVK